MIQAIEQNPRALWGLLASNAKGGRFEETGGLTLYSLGIKHTIFNSVIDADITPGNEDTAIDLATDFFVSRGLPWSWKIGPATQPFDLGEKLLERGFTKRFDVPGMGLDLRGFSAPIDSRVHEVHDEESYRLWLQLIDRGFGLPVEAYQPFFDLNEAKGFDGVPARYFYILDGEVPVSFSMVFYAAGVAGIFNVATVPEAQKRGLGQLVTSACLSAAVEDGYDVAILHSSQAGVPLYKKMGFEQYCTLEYFSPP